MLRRMEFMLKYNDLHQQDSPQLATAPTLSAAPNFGHKLDAASQLPTMWLSSPLQLLTRGAVVSERAEAALESNQEALQITAAQPNTEIFSTLS